MDTSRRAFLRGAASIAAIATTGGGSAVAQTAFATASATAGAAGTVDRVARVFEGLGRSGGFPHGPVSALKRIWEALDPQGITGLQARINGDGGWRRLPSKKGVQGKVDFDLEEKLFTHLYKLPRDVPLLDLLSDDIFQGLNPGEPREEGFLSFYWNDLQTDLQSVQELREFLRPLCNADTTAGELIGRFQNFFRNLAQHALQCPDDFENDGFLGLRMGGGDFHRLIKILQKGNAADAAPDSLVESLEQARAQVEKSTMEREQQMHKRQMQRWEDSHKKYIEEAERQKHLRHPYEVRLFSAGGNRYVLSHKPEAMPTRMDWLHWVQSIDPQNAKAADIELDHMGMTITVKNEKALAALNAEKAKSGGDTFLVALPNRRTDVDLYSGYREYPLLMVDKLRLASPKSRIADLLNIK